GQTAANQGTWSHTTGDVVSLTASAGTITQNADGTWSWTYPAQGDGTDPATVSVTATDSLGQTSTASFALTVDNVAPTITALTAARTAASQFTVSGSFVDPGTADQHTVTIDWADGSGAVPVTPSGNKFSAGHRYTHGGKYAIHVKVADQEG